MCKDYNGVSWLLYSDHGSDTIIKLCGRPDCNHTDVYCNAYFDSATSICYYNGFLYTFDLLNKDIIRMNLDGTERTAIYNITSFSKAGEYKGQSNPQIVNGIFIIGLTKVDENGVQIVDSYYYNLDGSMDDPKPVEFGGCFMEADGESFVGVVDYDIENDIYTYGIWSPDKGVVSEIFKSDYEHAGGYIGTKAEYYFEDGIIIENSYAEGKKELIDTGLKGNYQLACFPDCMVAYECVPDDSDIILKEATLHFYSWDYNDLGSVKINYKFNEQILGMGFICGETPERIILTDDFDCVPRYYVNKSDLGTGNIEIHPFKLPEGIQSKLGE